jgi:transaldolase
MTKNAQILKLNELGQSVWYDNLSRDVLKSGELQSIIDSGVSGLTSNPTIFKQAIADTNNYDGDMQSLAKKGLATEQICEELMVQDVATAADLLKPIYTATNGGDGYASIEVSPFLARDCQGTIDAARRIWGKLNRPNIMIKIPATTECIPAIRTVLEEGMNVNITLIFTQAVHEQVIEAYIAALEARAAKGLDLASIASVASYFVSRVDAICEKKFDELVKGGKAHANDLKLFQGKVGIANSKLAYARYEEIVAGERFKKLQTRKARVQRPLWASTGTKNPAFSPVLYIEELAGKDTVNTMPPATLKALLKGATIEPRLHRDVAAATEVVQTVEKLGVPLGALLDQLQVEGVKSFADSYQALLDSIEAKRAAV